jgi:DGQHR domain-containing protein
MPQDKLRNEVGEFLKDFGFEAYWPNDPIPMSDLNTSIQEPLQVEIDIVAKIGSTGFLVEVTMQRENNERKIKNFISKYRAVKECSLSLPKLISLFSGVPAKKRANFREVKEWKAIYLGTSRELIDKNIEPDKFSDSEGLTIINVDAWDYINALKKVIGRWARFEFISFLGLNPNEIEGIEDTDKYFEFHKLEGRKITGGGIEADIFQFAALPDFLLRTCKVFRYYGLLGFKPKVYFQRMLIKKKVEKIRKFLGKEIERCFPTPITVVLPKTASIREREGTKKLAIPFTYGSISIIDGQHRLYAYASSLPKRMIEKSKILVNGIKFHTENDEEIVKFSARTFIDINREQMKVKTSLIYLTAYDVMGDESSESLAGKIISDCNLDTNSVLYDLFAGRPLRRKSRLGLRRTDIVESTEALAKIVEEIRKPTNPQAINVAKMLGKSSSSWSTNELIEVGKKLLNKNFGRLQKVLPDDWVLNTKSILFKSKYIAAFILLLQDSINKGRNFDQIENRLIKISDNIKSTTEWKKSVGIPITERGQVFHIKRAAIPSVKFASGKILKGLLWYEKKSAIWPELLPSKT